MQHTLPGIQTARLADRAWVATGGTLKKNSYDETRPKIPHFTTHSEFFKSTTRHPLHIDVATWSLGLRAQTPAFSARSRSEKRWNHHFQERDCTFDMLRDVYEGGSRSHQGTPRPRVRVDPYRQEKHTDEDYSDVLRQTNPNVWRFLDKKEKRADVIHTMLNIRPA
mmetsp:Transcript_16116/g.27939  ORF Transcript_16116/g.27939 Transcript_16116/m.27939 type:complete len:166 (-) Transcript_16116:23-520(-)